TVTLSPGMICAGTSASSWTTPETRPRLPPAYRTFAAAPPIVTETVDFGSNNVESTIVPSGTDCFHSPNPEPNNVTVVPRLAGWSAEFKLPSWLNAALCPWPVPSLVNSAGEAGTTGRVTGRETLPLYVRMTSTLESEATPCGTTTSTNPLDAAST